MAAAAGSFVGDDFGAARVAGRRGLRSAPASALGALGAPRSSAVSSHSRSCSGCCSTGTAFPPRGCAPSVWTVFRRPSGTVPCSDFCRVMPLGSLVPVGFRVSGARQISLGKVDRTSSRPRRQYGCTSDRNGASSLLADSPGAGAPYGASLSLGPRRTYGFFQTRPRGEDRRTAARDRVDWLPGLRALASSVSDSLCQGSGTGFSPPVRFTMPTTPGLLDGRVARLRSPSLRCSRLLRYRWQISAAVY